MTFKIDPSRVEVSAFKNNKQWWVYALFCGEDFGHVMIAGLREHADVPNDPWVKACCVRRVQAAIDKMTAHEKLTWASRQMREVAA